jgi:integrase
LKDVSYVFTEPKSAKSRRTIALPPSATLLLKEHWERQKQEKAALGIVLADEDLVFGTLGGNPLHPNIVANAWDALATR